MLEQGIFLEDALRKIIIDGQHGQYRLEHLISSGGQGFVFEASHRGYPVALKIYREMNPQQVRWQKKTIEDLLDLGILGKEFLSPTDILLERGEIIGYVMPLMEKGFTPLAALPEYMDFHNCARAFYNIARSFELLQSKGLVYCDISFNNVAINPETGDIRIFDLDNA